MGGSKSYLRLLLLALNHKKGNTPFGGPFKAVQQQKGSWRQLPKDARERERKNKRQLKWKNSKEKKGQLIIINVFIFFVQRACEFALFVLLLYVYLFSFSLLPFSFIYSFVSHFVVAVVVVVLAGNWPTSKPETEYRMPNTTAGFACVYTLCALRGEVYTYTLNTWRKIHWNECKRTETDNSLTLLSIF